MQSRIQRRIKKLFSYATASGATLSLGTLSFCGMLVLTPSLPLAVLAFFLAIVIEGAVYRQNVFKATERLGNQKLMLKRAIARRELKKLRESGKFQQNKFLINYFDQKNYLHVLEKDLRYYSDEDQITAKREIERVKLRLQEKEELFINSICDYEKPIDSSELAASIDELHSDDVTQHENTDPEIAKKNKLEKMRQEIIQEVERKNKLMNVSKVAAVLSGACAGFVSLSTINAFLIYAGISAVAASFIATPVVAFAALGYGFMMYRTITDMIQDDTVKKWIGKIRDFIATPKKERTASFYLQAVGVVCVVAITAIATVATAGTWWYLAKYGAQLMFKLPEISATIVSGLTWVASLVPTFLFNVVNGLKSAKLIPGIIKDSVRNLKRNLGNAWHAENLMQFINPFRLLRKIFKTSVFVGHLGSIGVTNEQNRLFNPIVNTTFTLLNETGTDLPCIAAHSHDEHHDCHDHNHSHHRIRNLLTSCFKHKHSHHENPSDKHESLLKHEDHHEHCNEEKKHDHQHHHCQHDEEHDHQHGDAVLNQIETGITYLAAGWEWLTSKHSWEESKRKFFQYKNLPPAPDLSTAWIKYETRHQLAQHARAYEAEGIPTKSKEFATLENGIAKNITETDESFKDSLEAQINEAIAPGKPLAMNRHGFRRYNLFAAEPQSKQILVDVLRDRSLRIDRGLRA